MTRRARKDKSKRHSAKSSPSSARIKKKKSVSQEISVAPRAVSPYGPDKFTDQKRAEFLESLSDTGNITQSSAQCEISRVTIYNHRESDPSFEKQVQAALKRGVSSLEDEAKRRATGYTEDVYKNGVFVGKVKKYSDLLLLALLNAHWPEKYRPQRSDAPPAISPDDAKRLTEARDVLRRLDTDELATIATVMSKATERAVARSTQSNGKRTLQ